MTKKVVFSICTAMIVVFSFGFFKVNFLDRKESKLTVTNVDLDDLRRPVPFRFHLRGFVRVRKVVFVPDVDAKSGDV